MIELRTSSVIYPLQSNVSPQAIKVELGTLTVYSYFMNFSTGLCLKDTFIFLMIKKFLFNKITFV